MQKTPKKSRQLSRKEAAHCACQSLHSIIKTEEHGAIVEVGKFHHERGDAHDKKHIEDTREPRHDNDQYRLLECHLPQEGKTRQYNADDNCLPASNAIRDTPNRNAA